MKFRFARKELNITGNYFMRDLWRQKDLGSFGEGFETELNAHGVLMVKLRKA